MGFNNLDEEIQDTVQDANGCYHLPGDPTDIIVPYSGRKISHYVSPSKKRDEPSESDFSKRVDYFLTRERLRKDYRTMPLTNEELKGLAVDKSA
jgi:hypothetical protein